MIEINKCYAGNNLELIKAVDDNSIDLCLFSPPYDGIRDYNKGEWLIDLPLLGKEISRVLKDGAMCVMVIQDQTKDGRKSGTSFRTIIDWIDNTDLDLWECCIYHRDGKPGAWWNKRFRVDHEYIPIFIKGKRPQYFNKEMLKIPAKHSGKAWSGTQRTTSGDMIKIEKRIQNELKCRGTIWNYNTSNTENNKLKMKHPATFPDKLAIDCIQAFTTEGMVVLDPFAGSGTTLCMAKQLHRNYIGFEINTDYIENIINPRLDLVS